MFIVEVSHLTSSGDVMLEKANIPCAASLDEAKRIVRQWLTCRCPISHTPTHAKLFLGQEEVWSQCFSDRCSDKEKPKGGIGQPARVEISD